MNEKERLLDSIKGFSSSVGKMSRSSNDTKDYFGVLEESQDDYIYEFYCAMRILNDLSSAFDITLHPNNGRTSFPRNPANKERKWSFFVISLKSSSELQFQFCLGTKIQNSRIEGDDFGADISIQRRDAPENSNPTEEDVYWILDAKYKTREEKKISKNTLKIFSQSIQDYTSAIPIKIEDDIKALGPLNDYLSNSLITNGQCSQEHFNYCEAKKILVLQSFSPNKPQYEVLRSKIDSIIDQLREVT